MSSTKIKIARKLMSWRDKKNGVPPFLTKGWNLRASAIKDRVEQQQKAAHERALARKKANKKNHV